MTGSELRAFAGMKYFNVYVSTNSGEVFCAYEGDSAVQALTEWFKQSQEHPSEVAINATSKEAACMLIDFAHSRKDIIKKLYYAYQNFYNLHFILNAIDQAYDDRCKAFYGYGDSVYPFVIR